MSDTVVSAATTSRSPFSLTLATSLGRGRARARADGPASSLRASDRIVGGPRRTKAARSPPSPIRDAGRTRLTHRVTLIPGDGVGPEVIEAARRVIEATGVAIDWERRPMGAGAFSRTGQRAPGRDPRRRSARTAWRSRARSRRPVTSGLRSSNLELRKSLDLYANVRPCRLYPGVPSVVRGGRPGRRAREHRGHVHGPRVRDGHRRGQGADRLRRGHDRSSHPRGLRRLDQVDQRARAASASCASPSRRRAAAAVRRSPRATRRTS